MLTVSSAVAEIRLRETVRLGECHHRCRRRPRWPGDGEGLDLGEVGGVGEEREEGWSKVIGEGERITEGWGWGCPVAGEKFER